MTREHERSRFFLWMAVVIVVIAFVGFSRTWFLKAWTDAPPLPISVHLHGLAATSWLLLYLTQTVLVDRGRTRLHRKLGQWGILVAILTFASALRAGIDTCVVRGASPHAIWRMALPFVVAPTFLALVVAGLLLRRNAAAHKRLMLLATIQAVTPAVGRLPILHDLQPASFVGAIALLLGAVVVFDLVTIRRIHLATVAGVIVIGLSVPARVMLGRTEIWTGVAHRICG